MDCPYCGFRMDKLTRTYFSFNTTEGACPACEGLGQISVIDSARILDDSLSLEQGAVRFWEKRYGEYQSELYYAACRALGIEEPHNIPLSQYTALQRKLLLEGKASLRGKPNLKKAGNLKEWLPI